MKQINTAFFIKRIGRDPAAKHRREISKAIVCQSRCIAFFGGESKAGGIGAGGGKRIAEGGVFVLTDGCAAGVRGQHDIAAVVVVQKDGLGGAVFVFGH